MLFERRRQSVFPLKDITDSFVLRTQNDKPFRHCEAVQTAVAIRSLNAILKKSCNYTSYML